MINLSDLKLKDIRNEFNIKVNGEMKEVVIFNLLGEDRNELKNKITELNNKGLDGIDLVNELYTEVFMQCTNIVVNESVIDTLNNPSGDMLKILQEVYDIIYEIQTETLMEKYQLICNLKTQELTRLMLLRTEETMLITEECKKVDRNIGELKEEFK